MYKIPSSPYKLFISTLPVGENVRLSQWSPTGGPQTTGGPCKNFDGPQKNWDIISIFMKIQIQK